MPACNLIHSCHVTGGGETAAEDKDDGGQAGVSLQAPERSHTPMVKSCSMPGVTEAMNLRNTTRY